MFKKADKRCANPGGAANWVGPCCLCGGKVEGFGHNAEPCGVGRCCDACNAGVVIAARIACLQDVMATIKAASKKGGA